MVYHHLGVRAGSSGNILTAYGEGLSLFSLFPALGLFIPTGWWPLPDGAAEGVRCLGTGTGVPRGGVPVLRNGNA